MTASDAVTDQNPAAVPFRTEVRQLLNILAHSLYSDREIFLRELISNASDALHRVQFEMVTNTDVVDADAELEVRISVDEDAKTITISDTGIGMSRQDLIDHLGTIAQSSARSLVERLEAGQRSSIIGQFGVGFYSAFVVADEVTVISRSHRRDEPAALWRSTGDETFTVAAAEREQRGTTVILRLKEEAHEFATPWRVRQIIRRHSNFVAFPVYVGDERANEQQALWRQAPRKVEASQYEEFYRQLTFDFEAPLLTVHLSTDAPVDLHALMFVPAKRERGVVERRVEGKIKLYSRKVLIQEEAKDLLPSHFRFIEGVVDSEDLQLNVSLEMIQSGSVLPRIKKSLASKLQREIAELAEKEPERYLKLWNEFGVFFKEGIATDAGVRDELLPLLRFASSASGDALISLAEYVGRLQPDQQDIYYVLAGDLESARTSPHLDALRERGLEVLFLVDIIDGYMLNGLREFAGHKLVNIDDPNLQLPGEAAAHEVLVDDMRFVTLVNAVKATLGERIAGVRASETLRSSPVRLVAGEQGAGREMDRIQRLLDRDYQVSPRVLEINRGHALIERLTALLEHDAAAPLAAALIEQLYESALLLEGLHPNPATMIGRIQSLMEAAAGVTPRA